MKRFANLKKIDTKDKNTIFEKIKELNNRSSIKMDETDVACILDFKGKRQAALFTLGSSIKTHLDSATFTHFLSNLFIESAKGVAVGILGSHSLRLSEVGEIISTIQTTANPSALVTFSSSTESEAEADCFLFILTTGVD